MSGGGTSPEQTKNLLKSGGDNHFTKGFRPSVKSQFLEETVPNSDQGLWKNKKLYNTLPFKEQILIRNFFFQEKTENAVIFPSWPVLKMCCKSGMSTNDVENICKTCASQPIHGGWKTANLAPKVTCLKTHTFIS